MPQIATEPVEPPAQDDIEAPSPGINHELIERRPPIFSPAHTAVNVLTAVPLAADAVLA